MRQEVFEKFVMQNRKKYDAFNLSATFIGCVCEFPQVSMTKMILRIKLPLTMLKAIANALQKRVGSNYRFVLSFNSALILLGALGILPPATSAMLHNLSTLGISLRSMTDLLEQKLPCKNGTPERPQMLRRTEIMNPSQPKGGCCTNTVRQPPFWFR